MVLPGFWMAFFLGLVERVLKRGRGEGVGIAIGR